MIELLAYSVCILAFGLYLIGWGISGRRKRDRDLMQHLRKLEERDLR